MAVEELTHLIRRKLIPAYGVGDTSSLLRQWWDAPTRTANDKRKITRRSYWVAYV